MAFAEEIVFEPDENNGGEFVGLSHAEDKKHSLSGLTQYVEGQRLHPGVPRDFIGTFEGWDYVRSIRENTRARQYENLMVEFRLNGRVHGSPKHIRLKSRADTIELPPVGRGPYPRTPYGRPRNTARSLRRSESRGDGLLRELFEQQKEQHRAELARVEQHSREMFEQRQRHDAELRQLEKEKQAEVNKRLEEKIAEAGSRKDDEPADWKTLLLQLAVEKVKGGDDETADGLLKMVKEEEGGGGFWTLANTLAEKAIENPQGAMQAIGAAAQMFGLTRQPPPVQPDAQAPQQPPQPSPAPVTRAQLSDVQIVGGIATALGNAIVADADPTPYAQEVRDILEERQHLRPTLEGMLSQEDEALLSTISATARVSFDALGRKPLKWVRDFRRALRCYGIGAETVPPVDVTQNGHTTSASVS